MLTRETAYPDVSANGAYLRAPLDLTLYHFFGTSLSSPIWGSIITLINGERITAGKGTVGFGKFFFLNNSMVRRTPFCLCRILTFLLE